MEQFSTFGDAMELFRRVNCVGNQNCIFIAYKDIGKNIYATGTIAGAVGIFASAVADVVMQELDTQLNDLYNYSGYLINQTENGIGIIPLNGGYNSPKKMQPFLDKFIFIPNQNLQQIIVKNYTFGNKNMQLVKLKGANGWEFQMYAFVREQLLPYQEVNFTRFMGRYKK